MYRCNSLLSFMKKKYYFIIIFFVLCILSINAQVAENNEERGALNAIFELKSTLFCGGDGTATNPYQICTAENLADLAAMVNSGGNTSGVYYKVMNDIDLSDYTAGEGWVPIGNETVNCRFQGNFEGNGKVINNLIVNRREENQGLFGYTEGATIKNLTIENCNVNGDNYVGGVVGLVLGGVITNCHVSGIVTGAHELGGIVGYGYGLPITNSSSACTVIGDSKVGGLGGSLLHSAIANSHATGDASGNFDIGGLAGSLVHTPLTNCYATGDLFGGENVGGVAGISSAASNTNCYATGNINGETHVGGLMGTSNSTSSIENCYATGDVIATGDDVGGLVGFNSSATIENSYATGAVTGADNVGGFVGNNVGAVSNCRAFSCKVESTGTHIGRIAGDNASGALIGNYAYNQMELWTNGVIITTLTPTPAHNNIHGADITYASAPPQAKVCKAIFYANDVYCESLNDTTFCDKVVHFQAVIDGFNSEQDTIQWFFDGDEYEDERNRLEWIRYFDPGEHHILVEMQVRFGNGEILSISGTLHVRVFWTQIKNYRR